MSIYAANIDQVALAAGVAKTVLELATPATVRPVLLSWWVEFDGVNASAVPVKVELLRATGAITGTTITPEKYTDFAPASNLTVRHTATAEGTPASSSLEIHRVHPQGGLLIQYPMGREPQAPVSSFLRLRCNSPAVVNVTVGMVWEE